MTRLTSRFMRGEDLYKGTPVDGMYRVLQVRGSGVIDDEQVRRWLRVM